MIPNPDLIRERTVSQQLGAVRLMVEIFSVSRPRRGPQNLSSLSNRDKIGPMGTAFACVGTTSKMIGIQLLGCQTQDVVVCGGSHDVPLALLKMGDTKRVSRRCTVSACRQTCVCGDVWLHGHLA